MTDYTGKLLMNVPRWYLPRGISNTNCIAAYRAKGVESQARSYVNLANPGTHDITATIAPTWDVTSGWIFNGSTQYLITDILFSSFYTVIIRLSNGTLKNWASPFGQYNSGAATGYLIAQYAGVTRYWYGTTCSINTSNVVAVVSDSTNHTFAMNNYYFFYDGLQQGTESNSGNLYAYPNYIGCLNLNGSGASNHMASYTQAFAVYDTILTPAQILELSNAMNDL